MGINATEHTFRLRIINSSGNTVHSAGDLIDLNQTGIGGLIDISWVTAGPETSRNVDTSYQDRLTDVRFELDYEIDVSGSTTVDVGWDEIQLEITYTPTAVVINLTPVVLNTRSKFQVYFDPAKVTTAIPGVSVGSRVERLLSPVAVGTLTTNFTGLYPVSRQLVPVVLSAVPKSTSTRLKFTTLLSPVGLETHVPPGVGGISGGGGVVISDKIYVSMAPVQIGATAVGTDPNPVSTGNLMFSQCSDLEGSIWTSEIQVASDVDTNSAAGVFYKDRFIVLYSKNGSVFKKITRNPGNWTVTEVSTGISGRVQGMALANSGVICALIGDRIYRSIDAGLTWIPGPVVTLDDDYYLFAVMHKFYILNKNSNGVIRHIVSMDAGKSWV